jgi:DNA-binding response OmpR family regulator
MGEPVKLKLLVADDDEDMQKAIKRIAERGGYEVVQEFDGSTVLETTRTERPDLILLDVTMPGADGRDVLAALKSDPATASIPVIVCSGRTDHTDRLVGLELGAEDYVAKPFEPAELLRKIAWVVEKSQDRAHRGG